MLLTRLTAVIAVVLLASCTQDSRVLSEPFRAEQGKAYVVPLPDLEAVGDSGVGNRSTLVLFEDGKALGPAHALHAEIREHGNGRYSHWQGVLYFSTSDNSDPNTNGRTYSVSVTGESAALITTVGGVSEEYAVYVVIVALVLGLVAARASRGVLESAGPPLRKLFRLGVPVLGVAACVAGGATAVTAYRAGGGVTILMAATTLPFLAMLAIRILSSMHVRLRTIGAFCDNAMLVIASLGISLALVESGLGWMARSPMSGEDPAQESITPGVSIPEEWKRRPVDVEGAARAAYWHGKLHVYNADNYRNAGDYTREEGKRRVVVLGDSITYGTGVAAGDTYSAVLEKIWQQADPQVRVYSLGAEGAQSDDILRAAKKWLPVLEPEIVIYGICLNDFLPSGVGQYRNNMAWQIPLPDAWKEPFEKRTKLGEVSTNAYNNLLIKAGIRNDFFTDILKDFNNYQGRFRRDVENLNQLVVKATRRPVTAMVLDQFPSAENGFRISRIAEAIARESGMDVVPTEDYYKQYSESNEMLYVSTWEGHPNELAHRIFAEMLARHLGLPVVASGPSG